MWLAERTLNDTELMVLSGPPSDDALAPGESPDPEAASIRYWVEEAGLAHRVEARVASGGQWVAVDFGPAGDVSIPAPGTELGN